MEDVLEDLGKKGKPYGINDVISTINEQLKEKRSREEKPYRSSVKFERVGKVHPIHGGRVRRRQLIQA
jgi:hypothetical protein